jgi:glycosyltransferase involved in cell wall biosynthesis
MKIACYELQSTLIFGGIQSTVWELSREFCARGHTVHLYGGHGPIRRDVSGEFAIRTYPYTPRERFPDFGTRFRALCERLSFARYALGPLCREGYDVIFVRKPYDMPAALVAKRRSGARAFYKSGGTEFFPGYRYCVKRLDGFLACSRFNADQIRSRTGLTPRVHYEGVNPVLFHPLERDWALRESFGIDRGAFVVVSVARLVGWKGFQYVIEAMQALRPLGRFHCLLVGDGDYRPSLEARVKEFGLGDVVTIARGVPQTEVARYYSIADAAVFPSIGDEAFGIAAVEAMACGVPVIASTSGGMVETIVDGETGFLVRPRDAEAIAAALSRLAGDPAKAQAMRENGHRRAIGRFNWGPLADELLAVFETRRA